MAERKPPQSPASRPKRPAKLPPQPLRDDDVIENKRLRGPVVRAGVGAVPAVWED